MFKDTLKELRKAKGISAQQLAKILDMPFSTYSKYEDGTSTPKYDRLCEIADYFDVSADYLLGRADKPKPESLSDMLRELNIDSKTRAVICAFAELNKEERAVFVKCLEEIATAKGPEKKKAAKVVTTIIKKLSPYKASAGFGYGLGDEVQWREAEVIDVAELRKASFEVEVDGDSMEPTISNGDIILIRQQSDIDIGQIGLFIHDGEGYVKEKGKGYLISHNEKYPPIKADETTRCVGLVIGKTVRA